MIVVTLFPVSGLHVTRVISDTLRKHICSLIKLYYSFVSYPPYIYQKQIALIFKSMSLIISTALRLLSSLIFP